MRTPQWFWILRSSIFLSLVISLLVGGAAGWMAAERVVQSSSLTLNNGTGNTVTTSTTPKIEIVPVESRPILPAYPSAFVTRRLSSVVTLVKKVSPAKLLEDRLVSSDRELGSAVALTSDGWLVTTAAIMSSGIRVIDVEAVWDGRTYAVTRAIRDTATDALFIKIDVKDLPVAALAPAEDVTAGVAVWLEPRDRQLYPEIVADTHLRRGTIEVFSSERAMRRFVISGSGETNWMGGAVWDGSGKLIGLLEAKTLAGWRVLPAGDVATALSSLLTTNEIRHAALGVRAVDLAAAIFTQGRETLPMAGAWLRADRRQGLPAVSATGPAAKALVDGDVIEKVERDILDGGADLGERLLAYRPGAHVVLSGHRKDQTFEVSVTLGSSVTSEVLK